MDDLRTRVEALVADIPPGRVMTYGDIAACSGYPGAARRVGTIASSGGEDLPWHRVVGSTGRLAPTGEWQVDALTREGVVVSDGRIRNFDTVRWFPEIV